MEKSIQILLVEDSEYYNKLIYKTLLKRIRSIRGKKKYQLVLSSFTDPHECIQYIKTGMMESCDLIAFVDYYLNRGINGGHISRLLKELNKDATVILISHSDKIQEKILPNYYDYFIVKDTTAPEICRLHLEQFLENKNIYPVA